jgi:hypothetical protein
VVAVAVVVTLTGAVLFPLPEITTLLRKF